MAGKCTVCAHPQRTEIEAELLSGTPYRNIVEQFSEVEHKISLGALSRHVENGHIAEKAVKSQDAKDIAQADDLVQEIKDLKVETHSLRVEAKAGGSISVALTAIDKQAKLIELQAKMEGRLRENQQIEQVNIYVNPQFQVLVNILNEELKGNPELRKKIAGRLNDAEQAGIQS